MKVKKKTIVVDVETPTPESRKETAQAVVSEQDTLLLAEAKIAVPLLHGLLRLRNLSPYSAVLQISSTGFYVQVQEPVSSDSASGSGITLKWQPITKIFSSPLEAIQAALAVPFGRNLTEPPPPLQSDTEGQEGAVKETPSPTQEKEPEEDELIPALDKTIIFAAVSMTAGGLGSKMDFVLTGATSDKLYSKVKNTPSLAIVFDNKTGTSIPNGSYQITEKMLGKINSAILAFNSLSKTPEPENPYFIPTLESEKSNPVETVNAVIAEKAVAVNNEVQKELQAFIPKEKTKQELEKEGIAELEAVATEDNAKQEQKEEIEELRRLHLLVGKRVVAEKKYASFNHERNPLVEGEYRGASIATSGRTEHIVFGRSGTKNRQVYVNPETIKAV